MGKKKAPLELKEGRCSIIRAFFISAGILLNVLSLSSILSLSRCWLAATITGRSSHGTCLVPVDILVVFLNSKKKKTFLFSFICLSSNQLIPCFNCVCWCRPLVRRRKATCSQLSLFQPPEKKKKKKS